MTSLRCQTNINLQPQRPTYTRRLKHMKSQEKDELIPCRFCPKKLKRYEDIKIHNRRKHQLSLTNYKIYKTWFNSEEKNKDKNTTTDLQSMIGELEELQDIYWEEINQQQPITTQEKSTQTYTEFNAPDGPDYHNNHRIINENDHLTLPCEIHRGITTPTDDLQNPTEPDTTIELWRRQLPN